MENILKRAHQIIYERSEEKERQYGPFHEGMEQAAKIVSLMSRKEFTAVDMFNAMIALKLSRQSYNHKEDNLLDCVSYMASLNDYQNNVQNEHSKDKKRKDTK